MQRTTTTPSFRIRICTTDLISCCYLIYCDLLPFLASSLVASCLSRPVPFYTFFFLFPFSFLPTRWVAMDASLETCLGNINS